MPTVEIGFKADLSQLITELQRMPDAAGKEAKAMVANLSREIRKAEKTAAKAAKGMGKSFKKGSRGIDDMSESVDRADSALKQLAGGIGRISPVTELALMSIGDMAGTMAMMMNPIGAAVGGMAALSAATMVVAGGLIAATLKADDFLEELKELEDVDGFMPEIDPADLESMERVNAGLTAIKKTAMATVVVIGTEFAPALEGLVLGFLTGSIAVKTFSERIDGLVDRAAQAIPLLKVAGTVIAVGTGNAAFLAAGAMGKLAGETLGASQTFTQARTEAEALIAGIRALGDEETSASGSTAKLKDEIDELISVAAKLIPKEATDRAFDLEFILQDMQDAAAGSASALARLAVPIEAVERAIRGLFDAADAAFIAELVDEVNALAPPVVVSRLAAIEAAQLKVNAALQMGTGDTATLQEAQERLGAAASDEWAQWQSDAMAGNEKLEDTVEASAQKIRDAYAAMASQVNAGFQNMAAAAANFAGIAVQNALDSTEEERELRGDSISELESELQSALSAREAIQKEASGITAEQERATTAAGVEQLQVRLDAERAAQAQVEAETQARVKDAFLLQQSLQIAQTTMATATAIIQAMAQLGPIAGPAMSATIAALGASQIALIGAQEPPSLHAGGIISPRPDERAIMARAGEGVLTRAGVNAIGGEAGLAAANRGQGGGPMVIQMRYKHRVLDEVLQDSVKRGGPIQRAINRRSPRGRRNPYGRRAG